MVERAVVADLGGLADHHPHPVIDEEAAADPRPRVDLDARQPAGNVGYEPREPFEAQIPQPAR